jgi:ribosome biogenesis GTPase A
MSINWFPGHMAVAVDKIKKAMKDHDLVIEVLDARCPMASANPLIESLRSHRQRPCLKVLNKADLADAGVTQAWLVFFNAQKNVQAIALSCKKPGEAAKVIVAAKKLAPHRDDNLKPLRALIMGGLGIDVVGSTPKEFEAYIDAQIPKWAAVVRSFSAQTH